MGTPTLVQKTIHAATHPISSAAYVVGLVRGSTAALVRAAAGSGGPAKAEWSPTPAPLPDEAVETPESEIARDLAVAPEPADPADYDEYDDTAAPALDAEPADSVVEALRRNDPGEDPAADVDESVIKAILSESETLRRAADTRKD
jgi:hypothetical protein